MPKTVLMVGDSELAPIKTMKEKLQQRYDVEILLNFQPGRGLVDSAPMIRQAFRRTKDIDIVLLFGLTCAIWKKQPVILGGTTHNMITYNAATNMSLLPSFLDTVTIMARHFNPKVAIYVVIPSIKDICTFNAGILTELKNAHLIPELEKLPNFSRDYLTTKARKAYRESEGLISNRFGTWAGKNTLPCHVVFNHFYYKTQEQTGLAYADFPHHLFLHGKVDKLGAEDLCYDGLHYTFTFFDMLFEFLSPLNFSQRESSSTTDPVSPMTINTFPTGSHSPISHTRPLALTNSSSGVVDPQTAPVASVSGIGKNGEKDPQVSRVPHSGSQIRSRVFVGKAFKPFRQATTPSVATHPKPQQSTSTSSDLSSSVPIQTRITITAPSASTGAIPKRPATVLPTASSATNVRRGKARKRPHPAAVYKKEQRAKKRAAKATGSMERPQSTPVTGPSSVSSASDTAQAVKNLERVLTPIFLDLPRQALLHGVDKASAIGLAQDLLNRVAQFDW